ncbi:secreted protein with fasciclin repeat domain [Psychroflexus torquis ATCC 700755]|uniref:Secreted protein with fasciclin repeat domain n=1 Tax=Psychroflexus torquis (strain ATCC 700755 / CIP 106069 / ACAM 623) TaxID=313595 RepID=K4II98_PSYTT|nr:fasciclin domain-containing protein [Psychroflexus torquis]AFU70054.1 secreted protein with fasciclin repeat domain [Psychroflexus torquis ATCC 700755]
MKKLILSLSVIAMIAFTSCKNSETEEKEVAEQEEVAVETETSTEGMMEEPQTIVEIAVGNENFSTLVVALKAAGLVETLSSEGPFTVFAPTNDAFGKLPEGTVPTLVMPENKEKLAGILTYHVVSGEFMAADVVNAITENDGSFTIPTVQGEELVATLEGESVILTDANGNKSTVVIADVDASNGVIHAIDSVVMPKS